MSFSSPYKFSDIPIGLPGEGARVESDSMGEVAVPASHYWGAQTARSLLHFSIGEARMPAAVCRAYGYIKKAAALLNAEAGRLPQWKADAIVRASEEVISGALDSEFPLYVFQTGSGTHTNMNVNEVVANRAIQLLGGVVGSKVPVHPNDDVNMGQSSNDTFPSAMHIAAVMALETRTIPRLRELSDAILEKSRAWTNVVKVGRTHLQDAVPLTVGQEWSGYAVQLREATARLQLALPALYELAAGGTAVGTGLHAPEGFGEAFADKISSLTGYPFVTAPNKFAALAGIDAMVAAMAQLRGVAVVLMKFANDLRWLASGPRCGLGELLLPENEPGSSIMPGKVNPTQCEAVMMVCLDVMASDAAVAMAGSQGVLELNTMRPVVVYRFLDAARILADACDGLKRFAIDGLRLNESRIAELVARSLMQVTALSPVIGYDAAASIAHLAHHEGITLREAALRGGLLSGATFDGLVDPRKMIPGYGSR